MIFRRRSFSFFGDESSGLRRRRQPRRDDVGFGSPSRRRLRLLLRGLRRVPEVAPGFPRVRRGAPRGGRGGEAEARRRARRRGGRSYTAASSAARRSDSSAAARRAPSRAKAKAEAEAEVAGPPSTSAEAEVAGPPSTSASALASASAFTSAFGSVFSPELESIRFLSFLVSFASVGWFASAIHVTSDSDA